jgi:glutamyl-Q tRNA(Asp) synthetase
MPGHDDPSLAARALPRVEAQADAWERPGAGLSYIGRFAPSPSGPLHAGSLVAALASWLDARANGGTWLVRIEDVDGPRTAPGAEEEILRQLHALGLVPDAPPTRQSERNALYQRALQQLRDEDLAYPCGCTRREIESELAALGQPAQCGTDLVYPGTCRNGLKGKPARAWRLRCGEDIRIVWHDRRLGEQRQDVTHAVGDFVLQRADGPWAYQLAVVVDDAEQGITDVVRGEDLADNSARQIHLQRLLGLPTPRYLHTPLLRDARGDKLSKSNGAAALDVSDPLTVLRDAAEVLGLSPSRAATLNEWLQLAVQAWRLRWSLA